MTERPATTPEAWLERAILREEDRGDDRSGARAMAQQCGWFKPRWRHVIIKWYREVGRVYRMCPVTLESALYFLDSYLVETMDHERTLAAADFQMVGMVSLLLASKMYSTGPQVKVADLVQLAPQLRVKPKDVCALELALIQTLSFNLFVPAAREFAMAVLSRVESTLVAHVAASASACSSSAAAAISRGRNASGHQESSSVLAQWADEYLQLLASDFGACEYRQSERGVAVARVAVAKWCLRHARFESASDEALALAAALHVLSAPPPSPAAAAASSSANQKAPHGRGHSSSSPACVATSVTTSSGVGSPGRHNHHSDAANNSNNSGNSSGSSGSSGSGDGSSNSSSSSSSDDDSCVGAELSQLPACVAAGDLCIARLAWKVAINPSFDSAAAAVGTAGNSGPGSSNGSGGGASVGAGTPLTAAAAATSVSSLCPSTSQGKARRLALEALIVQLVASNLEWQPSPHSFGVPPGGEGAAAAAIVTPTKVSSEATAETSAAAGATAAAVSEKSATSHTEPSVVAAAAAAAAASATFSVAAAAAAAAAPSFAVVPTSSCSSSESARENPLRRNRSNTPAPIAGAAVAEAAGSRYPTRRPLSRSSSDGSGNGNSGGDDDGGRRSVCSCTSSDSVTTTTSSRSRRCHSTNSNSSSTAPGSGPAGDAVHRCLAAKAQPKALEAVPTLATLGRSLSASSSCSFDGNYNSVSNGGGNSAARSSSTTRSKHTRSSSQKPSNDSTSTSSSMVGALYDTTSPVDVMEADEQLDEDVCTFAAKRRKGGSTAAAAAARGTKGKDSAEAAMVAAAAAGATGAQAKADGVHTRRSSLRGASALPKATTAAASAPAGTAVGGSKRKR